MDKTTLVPELLVDDLVATIKWYVDVLGFKLVFQSPESGAPFFARISRGSAEIMLFRRQEFAHEIPSFAHLQTGGSFVLYLTVDDIHPIWEKVKDKVKVIQSLHTTDYGTTEFTIFDCNGYHLMFGSVTI